MILKKHTPGPWTYNMLGGGKGRPNEYSIRIDNDDSTSKSAIALCHRDNGCASANARLIASAPDILKALKRAVGGKTNCVCALRISIGESGFCWVCEGREAIAKAEGQS